MAKSVRIAIVSHAYPTFDGGNKGEFVHGLASALVNLGHRVYAVIPWERGMKNARLMDGVQLEPYYARDSISYGRASNAYVRYPRPTVAVSLVSALLKLRRVIRERNIDIIHAHWAVPLGFVAGLAKATTGRPLVITMHGRDIRANPNIGSTVPTLWYVKPFLQFAFRQADRLITVSRRYGDYAVRAGAPAQKLHVICNGINQNRFFVSEAPVAELRQRYRVAAEAKMLLLVGGLDFHKGFDVFIRAMPRILEAEPEAKAVIVGDGPEQGRLTALRNELGISDRIIFAGHVPNSQLAAYNNACDLFVMPSREESFGVAAVEAMACGKPVVGTTAGGLSETIEDGQTGLLVPPDNVDQLAQTITRVLRDKTLSARLGQNGRRKVEIDYNWINVARQTVALYEDVLRKPVGLIE